MTLYDSKYVYFEWDDKLAGKEGFIANTISSLKEKVNDGSESCLQPLCYSNNPTGYHFSSANPSVRGAYVFAYYDPYYEFRKAYVEGKQLQFKDHEGNWKDVLGEPLFNGADEYRIKPEDTYIPFDTVQELIDAWDEKYPQNKNRPESTMPLIWIKNKQKNRVYLITDFLFEKVCNCDVGTEDENLKLKELFKDYTFADGTVIGKKN